MDYRKITNQLSQFSTRNWIEINDESRGKYDYNSDIKFKTSVIRPDSCDYSDTYIYMLKQL